MAKLTSEMKELFASEFPFLATADKKVLRQLLLVNKILEF